MGVVEVQYYKYFYSHDSLIDVHAVNDNHGAINGHDECLHYHQAFEDQNLLQLYPCQIGMHPLSCPTSFVEWFGGVE